MFSFGKNLTKSIAYGALGVATGGRGVMRRVGGERIRFPARWCRYYEADYEPHTFVFLREQCSAGDTVLDIGAHIGLFSVVMARRVGSAGRVVSFEPTQRTREVLTRIVALNGCEQIVEVRREAVADCCGESTFYDTGDTMPNANSLIRGTRSNKSVQVPTITIDELVASQELTVKCMKIDVEGAELSVLRGAASTIRHCRPAIHLALHPAILHQMGVALAEVWRVLEHYNMMVSSQGRAVGQQWFCDQHCLFDVQALPVERSR